MFKILFENQDLLVINKPPGVVVTDAQTVRGQTVQAWMREQLAAGHWRSDTPDQQYFIDPDFDDTYGTPTEIFQERAGIVHRLDKDTSGALVLAKNPGSLVALLAQFKQRQVKKKYQCLVHGLFNERRGEITAPIARSRHNRHMFTTVPDGRPAQTQYQVLQSYAGLDPARLADDENVLEGLQLQRLTLPAFLRRLDIYEGFSLVECQPLTGRTHQIRVHMTHLQHPLVGDTHYLGKKRRKIDPIWCSRQFLHSAAVVFSDPRTREKVAVEAPLMEDLEKVLQLLILQPS